MSSRITAETQKTDWKTLTDYQAHTTVYEKINRVANHLTFGTALYGAAQASFAGPLGILSYAGMAFAMRKLASTIIGYAVYPAAVESLLPTTYNIQRRHFGRSQMESLKQDGYITQKITLNKSGTKYDAVMVGHASTIDNGKWTIHALGHGTTMELYIQDLAEQNFNNHSNTLLINGPSVGESKGWPTRYQLGAGLEAGLQLLEHEVKATHIVMRGFSLGGGMMAEAILNHHFEERNMHYLSISDRTFSRLSTIAGHFIGRIAEPIFYLAGTELDGIGAAKKLSDLNVRHIMVQHSSSDSEGNDCLIPDKVSLAHEIRERGLKNKVFLESEEIKHNGPLPIDIQERLDQEIADFFQS